jgi:hypothetical protein
MAMWRETEILKSIDKGIKRISSEYIDRNISERIVASKGVKFGGPTFNVWVKTEYINEILTETFI